MYIKYLIYSFIISLFIGLITSYYFKIKGIVIDYPNININKKKIYKDDNNKFYYYQKIPLK